MRLSQFLTISGLIFIAVSASKAGDLKQAATFSEPESRWSISAGAMVRSIDADFHVARPTPFDWRSFLGSGRSGRGDAGLYGGGLRTVRYNDGSVGPDYGIKYDTNGLPTGDAVGLIHSGSQLSASGRFDSFNLPIADLAFHSSGVSNRYSVTNALHDFDASGSDAGVGPYLNLSYELRRDAQSSILLSLGWSLVQTQHGSGPGAMGLQTIATQRTRSDYTYHYDYDGAGGALLPGTSFPYNADQLGQGFILYDPAAYDAAGNGTGFLPPRKTVQSSTSSGIAAVFVPVTNAHLAVTLNEIVFAAQYQRHLTDRLHLGLSAGPTLNIIDASLDASVSWFLNGRGSPVATFTDHTSSTDVKVGLMGQVSLSWDVTRRVFLEAHGSFRWVDPVTVGGSLASVRVNPSSWEGGVGVGWRF